MEVEANVASPEATNEAPMSVVEMPKGAPDKMTSIREAARQLANWRKEKRTDASAAEAPAAAGVPTESPPQEGNDAAETPPVETQEHGAAPEVPPVEPPRSWVQAEKERFASLPRETQEYISERERDRERAISMAQQEAAERQKTLDATLQQAEQTRQQYETALPVLLQNLQQAYQAEFSDIQSMADVEKMAREDPLRYTLWDAQQKKVAAVHQELQISQQRQQQEAADQWQQFAAREDALFVEHVPEVADTVKGAQLRESAVKLLTEFGFSQDEMAKAWNGQGKISLRDHRLQRLIVDAVKYREAKTKIKTEPPKPVPPVTQRPGPSRGVHAAAEDQVKALEQKLDKTGNARDAARLLMARRQLAR